MGCHTRHKEFTTGLCNSFFKGTNRHHCRACGRIVCQDCLTSHFTGVDSDATTRNENLQVNNIIMSDGNPHKSCKECRREVESINRVRKWTSGETVNQYRRALWGRYMFLTLFNRYKADWRFVIPEKFGKIETNVLEKIEKIYGPIRPHLLDAYNSEDCKIQKQLDEIKHLLS